MRIELNLAVGKYANELAAARHSIRLDVHVSDGYAPGRVGTRKVCGGFKCLSTLQLSRCIDVSYKTTFVLAQKLRDRRERGGRLICAGIEEFIFERGGREIAERGMLAARIVEAFNERGECDARLGVRLEPAPVEQLGLMA